MQQIVSSKITEGKADFNSFIDEILELVAPALIKQKIDLPDLMEEFEQGVLFVTLHGSAEVSSWVLSKYYTNSVIICNYNFIIIYDKKFLEILAL